jgi:hypothetical protein
MLLSKFLIKSGIDIGCPFINRKSGQKIEENIVYRVQAFAGDEFNNFIDQQEFTQKNLEIFE